ncbi:uncharacterized protein G2W53_009720 [Senna tora]|uniref:Uncharacterized protein n=1 Tax=Senna tora TaxID=362788 RepID=A0A834WYM3_9FABA|nr:uncharacterized protein G2W53_009720 [Senna tora]
MARSRIHNEGYNFETCKSNSNKR